MLGKRTGPPCIGNYCSTQKRGTQSGHGLDFLGRLLWAKFGLSVASWAERVLFLWIQGVLSPFCLHPTGSWYFLAACDWWGIVVPEFIDLSFLTVYILF